MTDVTSGQDIIVALITCADAGEAKAIASALIDARLAACAQWHAHESLYRWQGRLEQAVETRLLLKTTRAAWPALLERARALHSYELPAIVALEAGAVLAEYADWIRAEVIAPGTGEDGDGLPID